MIRSVRIAGFLFIVAGALVILTQLIEPLRQIWPWLKQLPLPIQIGFGLAALGLLILLGSLIYERIEERERDGKFSDEP